MWQETRQGIKHLGVAGNSGSLAATPALTSLSRLLEGTGSLVLDRDSRTAYACLSPRTTQGALDEFSRALGYGVVAFDALGPDGRPAYHTNVLMAVGEGVAVLCAESIADEARRAAVFAALADSAHDVIEIDAAEMGCFAGNLLMLRARDGGARIALSEAAWQGLAPDKRRRLERHGGIVAAAIPTIERHGGGSVRCMLAEVFLPRGAPVHG